MTMLIEMILKGTVVLAAGAAVAFVLRQRAAAIRHLVWSVTMAALVALPALAVVAPAFTVSVPVPATLTSEITPAEPVPVVKSPTPAATAADTETAATPQAASTPASAPAARAFEAAGPPADAGTSLAAFVVPFWAGGASLVLVVLLSERVRLRALARRAARLHDGPVFDTCMRTCREMGVARVPRLFAGADDLMPMTWGVLRPVILVPASVVAWPASRLEAVLRHEIAHIRRRDDATQLVATLGAALHWFNPLAWVGLHQLRVEREFACDDEVLRHGGQPSAYAAELIAVAARFREAREVRVVAQAMARPAHLRRRVLAVLAESPRRHGLTAARGLTGVAAALLLALPLAGVHVQGAGMAMTSPTPPSIASTALAHPSAPPDDRSVENRVTAEAPVRQSATACWQPGESTTSMTTTDDDYWRHTWRGDDCQAELTLRGELQFDDAFEQVVGVSGGGRFTLEIEEGGTRRQFEVSGSAGAPTFTWRVNGQTAPYDDTARAWVASVLPALFRATGLAAEARTTAIFARQGAEGVLREVDLMRSNSVRSRYLIALLGQPGLDDRGLVGALGAAAAIGSNSNKQRVLSAFDERHGDRLADAGVGAAFWRAVDTIDSNSTLRRLLLDVVGGEPANSALVGRIIDEAAARIDSNSTLASILRSLRESYPGIAASGPHAERYWRAVGQINSNSTVRDLLLSLTDGERLDSSLLPLVFGAAGDRISSSSDIRVFLVTMAERYPTVAETGPVAEHFWTLAGRISSSSTLRDFLLEVTDLRSNESPALDRALATARAGISSSSTMGDFLVDFASAHRGAANGRLEAELLAAANAISSRSTRERTLSRLAELGVG